MGWKENFAFSRFTLALRLSVWVAQLSPEELHTQSQLCDTGSPFCRTLNYTATSANQRFGDSWFCALACLPREAASSFDVAFSYLKWDSS